MTLTGGVREIESQTPMRRGDRFRIGSITKSFITALLLRVEAAGKLSINDTVERWLPGIVSNGTSITIKELLNHTSGLPEFTDDLFPGALATPLRVWSPQELLAIANGHQPLFVPGTQWSYSNTNYIVAGLIVEAATRKRLADSLRKDVFKQLGLAHTTFEQGSQLPGAYAHGYVVNLDVSVFNASIAWAAGAIASNARDLARFYRALLRGRLLRRQQLDEMETLVSDGDPGEGYGLGIFGNSHTLTASLFCGPPIWGHDGDFPGYFSVVLNTQDASRQVVILVNTDLFTVEQQNALTDVITNAWCGLGS
jgi:D-alanyl-D-alanine carboxypeptidase